MNSGLLVGVFDLGTALFEAHVRAAGFRADPALPDDRITFRSKSYGEVAGRALAGSEMLMKHSVRWRKTHAMSPVDALEIAVTLVPEKRIAATMDEEDVQAG